MRQGSDAGGVIGNAPAFRRQSPRFWPGPWLKAVMTRIVELT